MERKAIQKFEKTIPERGKLIGELTFRFYENGVSVVRDKRVTDDMLIKAVSNLPNESVMRLN